MAGPGTIMLSAEGVPPVSRGIHVTVDPWQTAVAIRDGRILGSFGPGRHRRRYRSQWYLFDSRPTLFTLPPQEVLTADGVQVRLSLVAKYSIVDAAAWLAGSDSPRMLLHSELQVALRDRVAETELAQISTSRLTLLDGMVAELGELASTIGIELSSVAVKDVTLPMEVRTAIAETALAKERGQAALERARAEAASLRSLANTAKLLDEHPVLLELRTLQAAENGAQIVIHQGAEK